MAELSTLARPYAKAAFEFAAEADTLQRWSDMLAVLADITTEQAVGKLLTSPAFTADQRATRLIEICGDDLDENGGNFVRMLAENRRLTLLPQIREQFDMLKADREKSVDVQVIAAGPVDGELQEKLARALSARLARTVNVSVSVDKTLLGGAVVRAGDTIIDGSVRGRLTKLAEALNS